MGWTEQILSLAGKEVLVKAVVTSVPTYSMAILLYPRMVCNEFCYLLNFGGEDIRILIQYTGLAGPN